MGDPSFKSQYPLPEASRREPVMQADSVPEVPESILAVIASFAAHASHPTELDTLRKVSVELRGAIDHNLSMFNAGRVLEISEARHSILNGLYYEDPSKTIGAPPGRKYDSDDPWSESSLEQVGPDTRITFVGTNGHVLLTKPKEFWKKNDTFYPPTAAGLEIEVHGTCYAAAYRDSQQTDTIPYSKERSVTWWGFERGTTPPGSLNGRAFSQGPVSPFAAHPWASVLADFKRDGTWTVETAGALLRTRLMWRGHEGEVL